MFPPYTSVRPESAQTQASHPPLIACEDYSNITRGPSNVWTSRQRVILAYLASFDISWRDVTQIFNVFFQQELPTANGLSRGAISSRWHGVSLSHDEEAALSILQAPSASSTDVSLGGATRTLIKKIAEDFGISLAEIQTGSHGEARHARTMSTVHLRKRKVDDINPSLSSEESGKIHDMIQNSSELGSSPYPHTPQKIQSPYPHDYYPSPPISENPIKRVRFATPVSPSKVATQFYHNSLSPDLDTLAFRAFSERSHGINTSTCFIAGEFVKEPLDDIPGPPEMQAYIAAANTHVGIGWNTPSPLISVTKSFLRALHLAIKMGSDAFLSAIDLQIANVDGRVQKAADLRLSPNTRYIAAGEYLIYGKIERSAIISCLTLPSILNAIESSEYRDIFQIELLQQCRCLPRPKVRQANEDLVLSYRFGITLGQFCKFLALPPSLLEAGVKIMLADFVDFRSNYRDNSALLAGTEEGYRGGQSNSAVSIDREGNTCAILEDEDTADQCMARQPKKSEDNVRGGQHSRTDSILTDEFINELQEAVALTKTSSPLLRAQFPFKSAMEIPEIKLEGLIYTASDRAQSCRRLESEMYEEETMGTVAKDTYDAAWTGM